jgi:hypothetical protein
MKPLTIAASLIFLSLGGAVPGISQTNTTTYVSHGYFDGLNLADSMLIEGDFVITIAQKTVEIVKVNKDDASKDEVYLKRRTMSALKYTTLEDEEYYVWKLGDQKMVLRLLQGCRYLSLYQTDNFGLPARYITFKLKE